MKILFGGLCIVAAFFAGMMTLVGFRYGGPWFVFGSAALISGLIGVGGLLIFKRRSALSKRARWVVIAIITALVIAPLVLDLQIRHQRKLLQRRAKAFLSRPLPKLLIPDSEGNVGGFYVNTNNGPQNGVLGYSLGLIERYATNGRIRWSARIQGQFASTSHGVNINYESDAIKHSAEVSNYLAERNAILGQEWNMGFWQWVEDTIEFKSRIPEHEEEDFKPAPSTNAATLQR